MCGIHFAVLCTAISNIFTNPRRSSSSRNAMAFLVVVMFGLSTAHSANYWAYVRRAFIAHGETRESIAEALNEYPSWYLGVASLSDANAILADCVIIWRCWIVWGRSWRVVVIPAICTMLTAVFSAVAVYTTMSSTTFGAAGADYATALYSTSLVTTLFCTSAIVYRYRQAGYRSSRNIIEIFVQSSALYCIATLFALVAYIRSGPASEFASAFWTSMTGIAPTLIIARVAYGETRPDDSWNQTQGSRGFLQFDGSDAINHPYELLRVGTPVMGEATLYADQTGGSAVSAQSQTIAHVRSNKV